MISSTIKPQHIVFFSNQGNTLINLALQQTHRHKVHILMFMKCIANDEATGV